MVAFLIMSHKIWSDERLIIMNRHHIIHDLPRKPKGQQAGLRETPDHIIENGFKAFYPYFVKILLFAPYTFTGQIDYSKVHQISALTLMAVQQHRITVIRPVLIQRAGASSPRRGHSRLHCLAGL